MGDRRKLAYLDALGVESYVPRSGRPVEEGAAEVRPVALARLPRPLRRSGRCRTSTGTRSVPE